MYWLFYFHEYVIYIIHYFYKIINIKSNNYRQHYQNMVQFSYKKGRDIIEIKTHIFNRY